MSGDDGQNAVLELEVSGTMVALTVTSTWGGTLYRSALPASTGPGQPGPGRGAVNGDQVVADRELSNAGWVRSGPWEPLGSGTSPAGVRALSAPVAGRPRRPITAYDEDRLDGLHRMTRMARGPVLIAALVPHLAPTWQTAGALVRRLVATGHVRAVARTTDARPVRTLYAPVGSTWAPELPTQPPV